MQLPNYSLTELVDKNGEMTPQASLFFSALTTQLQSNLNSEGFSIPQQTSKNILLLNTPESTGNILYNQETNQFLGCINGTYHPFSTAVVGVVGTPGQIVVTLTGEANFQVGIDPTYIGQSSITTLGTITSGTWAATNLNESQVNNLVPDLAARLQLAGGTMTGNLILNGNASTALQAVPLQQVTGMVGAITIAGTANQITVTGTSPNFTLSLPSTVITTTFQGALTGHASLDLAIANNLSDVASASTAATNLGLGTGNNVTFTGLTLSSLSASQAVVTDGSKKLASLAYTSANTPNTLIQRDGSGNFSAGTMSGLASLNLPLAGGTMTGNLILNADATLPLQAVTFEQLNSVSAGFYVKPACYAMTTSNLTGYTYNNGSSGVGATLTAGSNGAFATDGVSPPLASSILVPNQSTTFQNGIYTLTQVGDASHPAILTRRGDYDTTSKIQSGDLIVVQNGTANATTGWLQMSTVSTIGTDPITFSNFGLTNAGTGLTRNGNIISLSIPVAVTSGGTGLTSTTINQLLYSSANNTIAGLATANNGVLITSGAGIPSISSTLPTAVQNNITQVGTITSGVWNGTIIDSGHGGTGLGLPSPGYMLCGSATVGNYAFIPAPSAEQILGTDVTGGIFWLSTLPAFVQLNITSLGTISVGTWNGSVISGSYGGTGVNNGSSIITIGGNVTFSGAHTFTGTLTANTSVTFPTSGTLVNTAVTTLSSLIITETQVTNLTTDLASKLNLSGGTMTGNLILNADPTVALGACTKQYADAISAGLDIKLACYALTTLNLTAIYNNGSSGVGATLTNSGTQAVFTTDGVTPPLNSRIFVPNQSSTFQNGIYVLTNVGSISTNWILTRSTDYDLAPSQIFPGNLIVVDNGTLNSGTGWLQTATVNTIGTDPITFTLFNMMQAGTGLTRTGNTISLANPVSPTLGGTGVANLSGSTITLGGSLTFSGAFSTTISVTAGTSITLPTSGTLVNTAVTTLSSLVISESQVTNLTTDLAAKLNLSGGTMTGNLILNANAASALQAVPLQQLQSAANSSNFIYYTYFGGL